MPIRRHGRGHEVDWLAIPDEKPETKHLIAATEEEAIRQFEAAHPAPKPAGETMAKQTAAEKRNAGNLARTHESRVESARKGFLTKTMQGDFKLGSLTPESLRTIKAELDARERPVKKFRQELETEIRRREAEFKALLGLT